MPRFRRRKLHPISRFWWRQINSKFHFEPEIKPLNTFLSLYLPRKQLIFTNLESPNKTLNCFPSFQNPGSFKSIYTDNETNLPWNLKTSNNTPKITIEKKKNQNRTFKELLFRALKPSFHFQNTSPSFKTKTTKSSLSISYPQLPEIQISEKEKSLLKKNLLFFTSVYRLL